MNLTIEDLSDLLRACKNSAANGLSFYHVQDLIEKELERVAGESISELRKNLIHEDELLIEQIEGLTTQPIENWRRQIQNLCANSRARKKGIHDEIDYIQSAAKAEV